MQKYISFLKDKKKLIKENTKRFIYKKFKNVHFTFGKEYRSESEKNEYFFMAVNECLKTQNRFENFKRNEYIRRIIETVGENLGHSYLQILRKRNENILEKALKSVLIMDNLGNPYKFKYEGYDILLSPLTLRYLKVTSDINKLFGSDFENVAEIGAGYGGQALVNDQILNIKHTKLFDLPYVNKLIERYLNNFLFLGSYETTFINNERASNYDLVISNYAFSELPKELQIVYINKVLRNSKKGYLTMNSGMNGSRSIGKFSLEELRKLLPKFTILQEDPLTYKNNYIIAWGFEKNDISNYFKIHNLD